MFYFFPVLLFSLLFTNQEVNCENVDYYPPSRGGGSNLNRLSPKATLGEPLNVIISGRSSPEVLTDDGFETYANSIGFAGECLGLHIGNPQQANLGDGSGWKNQTKEYRQDYGDDNFGTCLESAIGGNHFRLWRQNGPKANSGALFLSVSVEESAQKGHTVSVNGYNLGRDLLVANATKTSTMVNTKRYTTKVKYVTDLIKPGKEKVNHQISQDGKVAVLTVSVTSTPEKPSKKKGLFSFLGNVL